VVVKGESAVNQAPITGESVPVDKFPADNPDKGFKDLNAVPAQHRAFAGAINGAGVLEIKVLKEAKDSTLSRLITLVKEAETQKSPTQLFTDRFEKWFVPAVLVLVVLLCFAFLVLDEPFSHSFYAECRAGGRGEGSEGRRFDKRRRTARRFGATDRHRFRQNGYADGGQAQVHRRYPIR
jgi:cation transport ATPase